ncbi:MAG: MipA/OmpV family protein [Deltaproteobacteria bacterium]|nr:MipA/OmpV family protein [Deltaproteobacteria bacterium]
MPSRLKLPLFLVFAALALQSPPASAQVADYGDGGGTAVTGSIGVGAMSAPEFEGSDRSEIKPLPFFNLRYGPVFLSTGKGLGIRLDLLDGALEISPALNYRGPRDEGESDLLAGMGDVEAQLTGGASIIYRMGDVSFGIMGFQGLSDADGFTLDTRLAYLNRQDEKLHWGFAAEAGFADADYNRAHFGVNEIQSLNSGYPVYTPSDGLRNVSLGGTVDYYLTPNISVDVFARASRLMGDPADSPLVRRGSPSQFTAGLLLFYHFGMGY